MTRCKSTIYLGIYVYVTTRFHLVLESLSDGDRNISGLRMSVYSMYLKKGLRSPRRSSSSSEYVDLTSSSFLCPFAPFALFHTTWSTTAQAHPMTPAPIVIPLPVLYTGASLLRYMKLPTIPPKLHTVLRNAETMARRPAGAVLLLPHAMISGEVAKLPTTPKQMKM